MFILLPEQLIPVLHVVRLIDSPSHLVYINYDGYLLILYDSETFV